MPTPAEGLPPTSAQVVHGVPLPQEPATPAASSPGKTPSASPKRAPPAESFTPATATSTPAPAKSPERQLSPEMDVDVGGTPEAESAPQEMALDSESDAIVQQLEKGLPRWEGLADIGWNASIPKVRIAARSYAPCRLIHFAAQV